MINKFQKVFEHQRATLDETGERMMEVKTWPERVVWIRLIEASMVVYDQIIQAAHEEVRENNRADYLNDLG